MMERALIIALGVAIVLLLFSGIFIKFYIDENKRLEGDAVRLAAALDEADARFTHMRALNDKTSEIVDKVVTKLEVINANQVKVIGKLQKLERQEGDVAKLMDMVLPSPLRSLLNATAKDLTDDLDATQGPVKP